MYSNVARTRNTIKWDLNDKAREGKTNLEPPRLFFFLHFRLQSSDFYSEELLSSSVGMDVSHLILVH